MGIHQAVEPAVPADQAPAAARTSPRTGPPGRGRHGIVAVAVAASTAVVLAAALQVSGSADVRVLGDPGPLVRWGLPVFTAIHHLSMSVVLASLVFAQCILHPGPGSAGLRARLSAAGRWAAALWAGSAALVLVLSFADTIGQPLSAEATYLAEFPLYVWGTTPGLARLVVLALAAAVAVRLFCRRRATVHPLAAALAAAAAVPLSLDGHALSADVPWAAAGLLALHVVGVALWVGGVIVLGLASPLLRPGRTTSAQPTVGIFQRFSRLAGVAYAAVLVSGIATAVLRVPSIDALTTPYGTLVLLKSGAILVLGAIGYLHRRWILAATPAGTLPSTAVWRLIGLEILVMAATIAMAVALGRTMPPMPDMEMAAAVVPMLRG